MVFAPSIGPALGGYFSDNFGWQSIFFLSLPPGVVMIAMLWYALEPTPRQLRLLAQGDWLGVVSMALGLGCLETVLEEGNKDDWFGSPLILRLALVGVVSLAVFIYVELKRPAPLLQLRLPEAPQLRIRHLREFCLRILDVRLDLSHPTVPLAPAGLQLSGDRWRDGLGSGCRNCS